MQSEKIDIAKEIEKYLLFQDIQPKKGEIVKCKIIDILDNFVIVELGLKTEGKIKKSEIDKEKLKKGEIIEAVFLGRSSEDGLYRLSYKEAKERKIREYVERIISERRSIVGVVVGKNKGFYEVDIGDFSGLGIGSYIAYCPFSLAEDIKVNGFYEFMVKEITQDGRFILSRKDYLNILKEEERKRVLEKLKPGAVLEGKIVRVTALYAEIDFGGGIRGRILRDDVDWGRVESCKDKLQKGQEVKVKILETEPYIRASLKHLKADPWEEMEKNYKVGDVVEGEVSDIKNFGVFVKIKVGESEIEALLPRSEAGWDGADLKEKFKIGQKISASIINISREEKRVTLSLRKILPNPYEVLEKEPDKLRKAIVVEDKGKVYEVEVIVDEAETKVSAILPKGELSWFVDDKIQLQKGQEIDVKVISVKGRSVIVSKRKAEREEFFKILKDINGKIVEGKVVSAPFKGDKFLWIEFDYNGKKLKGVIPSNELSGKISSYSKGETVKAEVIGFDKNFDVIILSENKAVLKETSSGGKVSFSLGNLLESVPKK
ncbi:30S ribosomal protein S1 [bacterium HR19]|nr:30S ribosomal protein S1 [bacterium HR19]